MNKTTELLNKLNEQTEILTNCSEGDVEYLKVSLENNIKLNNIKSELNGRLEVMKEWLNSTILRRCMCNKDESIVCNKCKDINYLQEQIKMIKENLK